MNDAELDTLEAKAYAAMPGPCKASDSMLRNAAFIAAANPSAVLELIAELRQARAERDWLAHHFDQRPCERDDQCAFELSKRDCHQPSQQCWIDAAKSGVEAAKESIC